MLIVMKKGSTPDETARVCDAVRAIGRTPVTVVIDGREAISVAAGNPPLDAGRFEGMAGVHQVVPLEAPYRLAARDARPRGTAITVGGRTIGAGGLFVVAGPCAVENEEQIVETARLMKQAGADALRGGAYKPRSSPYSFQGLGPEGLRLLVVAREATGLPIVSEAVDESSLDLVAAQADIVQIGARNMHNGALLKSAGRLRKPILLKRGMSATLDDLLMAAEFILDQGNGEVILCERGIRTFSQHSRFTLDLSVVPAAQTASHLPVFVDPSHAAGRRERVAPMARAAVAAGADGVIFEVHPDPDDALSDGRQALVPGEAAELIAQLREVAAVLSRKTEVAR
ncbi:MAG TPA: 3-deoxy-7-phosphoheptulonate synthase [Candidatus Polarisedimenticolaceae bacterium]|nr:3-deoxy-7-phosphoheptulonate synthase [Candidatus Polarisedimenticolaceae bacterium]